MIDNKAKKVFFDIGAKYFSTTVMSYVLWIVKKVKENKNDEICFLARDGYILKKCYDLYKSKVDSNIPISKYLYASRSIFYNSAVTDKYDFVDKLLCSLPAGQTLADYCVRWNIELELLLPILKKFNITKDYIINNENDRKLLKIIYGKLRNIILDNSMKQRKILEEYWKKEDIIGKKVAFVDIGWNGSCQMCIEKIISLDKLKIVPSFYFLGLLDTNNRNIINKNRYSGCFFEWGMPREITLKIFPGIPILDSFFSAPHPYILEIKKENNQIVPIYDDDKSLQNVKYMIWMQEGAMNKIKQFMDNPKEIIDAEKKGISQLIKLIMHPKRKQALAISKFKSSISYGTERYNINIIGKVKLKDLIKKKDNKIDECKNIMWKQGFEKVNNPIVKILLKEKENEKVFKKQ